MKNKKVKINEFNILGFTIQVIVTIIVLVFAIIALFVNSKFFPYLYLSMGIDLLIMSYNNKKIFNKEKNIVILYLAFGVLMILYSILSFLGVV